VEKYEDFSGWHIGMGYLPRWSHYNGLLAQMVTLQGVPAQ